MKATCKNLANLEQETKTTKIVTYPLLLLASSVVSRRRQLSSSVVSRCQLSVMLSVVSHLSSVVVVSCRRQLLSSVVVVSR